jgi:integrase
MPKKTEFQEGRVYVKEVEPRKWRASWTDPLTKRHVRRVLPVSAFEDAVKEAKTINEKVSAGHGFTGRLRGSVGHTVADAVTEAVNNSGASDTTKTNYFHRFNSFAKFLAANMPGIEGWGEVTAAVLENYLAHLRGQEKGRAAATVKHKLFVLKMTSAYMARVYPDSYRDVARGMRAKVDEEKDKRETPILTAGQLRALVAWLREHRPEVHLWALLQGAAGLRTYEAIYLTEADVDSTAKTVRVSSNEAHKVKTAASRRTIPVADVIAGALGEWLRGRKVRSLTGYVFTAKGDKSYAARTVCELWQEALAAARADGVPVPAGFIARKLRASFVTAAREGGADFGVLQRYIGHDDGGALRPDRDGPAADGGGAGGGYACGSPSVRRG